MWGNVIFFPGVSFVHVYHYAWITLKIVSTHVQIVVLSSESISHKPITLLTTDLNERGNCMCIQYFIPYNCIIFNLNVFFTIFLV